MNANGAPATADDAGLQRDPCEMLLRTLMAPEERSSPCTRWWVEELLAVRADPVCGEEPEVVERYMAWLSEDHLRHLDAVERRARAYATTKESAADRHRGSEHSERNNAGGSAVTEEDKTGPGEAEVWFEQMDHAMDAWAEVVRAEVDHANGVSPEERAQDSYPYAEWDGPPPFCSQADFASGDYFGSTAW